jgi:hypothetical protein
MNRSGHGEKQIGRGGTDEGTSCGTTCESIQGTEEGERKDQLEE